MDLLRENMSLIENYEAVLRVNSNLLTCIWVPHFRVRIRAQNENGPIMARYQQELVSVARLRLSFVGN